MAEGLYESGKIYVVVAVVVVLLVGFFVYLFATDRKIAQLRKRLEEE